VVALLLPADVAAQRFGYGEGAGVPVTRGLPDIPGGFTFCRLEYTSVRSESGGLGWSTDYPGSDRHLTLRLSELTTTQPSAWSNGLEGIAVFRPTDPELMQCPFLFTSDAGTAGFSPEEVEALREYFLKGGFLWVDDFWGERALRQFTGEMAKVLPEYRPVELPMDHELYSIVYRIPSIPQITALQFWAPGASTSERGAESETPRIYAIQDEDGRILVLMSHNTDLADGWEREGDDRSFFQEFSPDAYAIGVNVAVWVMTH
jgi:hypothetical protein